MNMRQKNRGEAYLRSHDTTGVALYLRIELELDGKIWDTNAVALSATTTLANSDIAGTEKDRTWSFTIPATLPVGIYIFSIFVMAGATPASTDDKLSSEYVQVG